MPAPFIEDAVIFPLDGFCSLVKDQVTIGVWVYFWVFNSIPLIYLFVAVIVQCSFLSLCIPKKSERKKERKEGRKKKEGKEGGEMHFYGCTFTDSTIIQGNTTDLVDQFDFFYMITAS